jgi:uncharacterized OB-fold protein
MADTRLTAGPVSGTARLLPQAWEERDDGRAVLLATRCGRCGDRTFPPAGACPRCWERRDLHTEPLPRRGTLRAFSVVHVPQPGIDAPYAVGYVDFPGGVRVCGRLAGWDELRPGDRVEPVAGVIRTDGPLTGWLFRKAREAREAVP